MASGGSRAADDHRGGPAPTRHACAALGIAVGIGLLVGCARRGSEERLASTERAVLAPGTDGMPEDVAEIAGL